MLKCYNKRRKNRKSEVIGSSTDFVSIGNWELIVRINQSKNRICFNIKILFDIFL